MGWLVSRHPVTLDAKARSASVQLAVQPFGHGQESVRGGAQHPFSGIDLGQHLRGERGCGLGVATELGQSASV